MRWRERLAMYLVFLAIITMGSYGLTLGVLSVWFTAGQPPGVLVSSMVVVGIGILIPIAVRLLPVMRHFFLSSADEAPGVGLGAHLWLGWFVAMSTIYPLVLVVGDPLHSNRVILLVGGGVWGMSVLLGYIFISPRPDSTRRLYQFLLGARDRLGKLPGALTTSGAIFYDVTMGILCMVMIGASLALTVTDILHLERRDGITLLLGGVFSVASFPVVHRVSRYVALGWERGRVSFAEWWRVGFFVSVFLVSFTLLDADGQKVLDISANVWHAGLSAAWIVACSLVLTLPARPVASRGGAAGADLYIEEDQP